jgi:hypothetical protein
MPVLCKFKDSLGKPGEGFHSTRIAGFALYDILGTLFIILVCVIYFQTELLETTIILIGITIFSHWIFCVPTQLNKHLNLA